MDSDGAGKDQSKPLTCTSQGELGEDEESGHDVVLSIRIFIDS